MKIKHRGLKWKYDVLMNENNLLMNESNYVYIIRQWISDKCSSCFSWVFFLDYPSFDNSAVHFIHSCKFFSTCRVSFLPFGKW